MLPLESDGFRLSATQFRDQLAIRYHQEPAGLPAECDRCGAPFSLQHGLDCMKGGLVKKDHNDLCDSDTLLADIAWGGVSIEPVLVTKNDHCGQPRLQADWMATGFGRVTEWRYLIITSLRLTRLIASAQTSLGRQSQTMQQQRGKANTIKQLKSFVDLSHHLSVQHIVLCIVNTWHFKSK